jgi:hypothetical protein
MRYLTVLILLLAASGAGATALPGTLWDNNDYVPGVTAGAGFTASARPTQSSTLPADDFFLDPADLEAARDPNNPDSCPEFRITQIRTRMFPRAEIADRPWMLVIHGEDVQANAPAPVSANATIALTPPPVVGPSTNTGEITISQSPDAVDAIWDFSASPITLAPGAYWLMAYKDTTGAQAVGWWTPSPSTDLRNAGRTSSGTGGWSDQSDFDFDIDGTIVDPCPPVSSQSIRGKSFRISDPSAGGDPTQRRVRIWAQEQGSSNPLVGDPRVEGATLEIIANGASPTAQTFSLPPELWRAIPGKRGQSFRYHDPLGEAGPVTRAFLRSSDKGVLVIRAQIDGRRGATQPLELTPPDDGTDAYAVLRILGGDRYCVKFGSDGTVTNRGARSFAVSNPIAEGCP